MWQWTEQRSVGKMTQWHVTGGAQCSQLHLLNSLQGSNTESSRIWSSQAFPAATHRSPSRHIAYYTPPQDGIRHFGILSSYCRTPSQSPFPSSQLGSILPPHRPPTEWFLLTLAEQRLTKRYQLFEWQERSSFYSSGHLHISFQTKEPTPTAF